MTPKGKQYCLWTGVTLFAIFGITFLVLAIALTPISNSVIKSSVNSQVFLSDSNVGTWGEIPGKYDMFISRNITMFDFQNPTASFFQNEKPVFQMTAPIPFQETQNVKNLKLDSDKSKISLDQTVITTPYN